MLESEVDARDEVDQQDLLHKLHDLGRNAPILAAFLLLLLRTWLLSCWSWSGHNRIPFSQSEERTGWLRGKVRGCSRIRNCGNPAQCWRNRASNNPRLSNPDACLSQPQQALGLFLTHDPQVTKFHDNEQRISALYSGLLPLHSLCNRSGQPHLPIQRPRWRCLRR